MKSNEHTTDAVVVGAGPAGLSLAAALIDRGIETTCIAPDLRPWEPNYGSWAIDLPPNIPVENAWPRAEISFPGRNGIQIDLPYVKIDGARLFSSLSSQIRSSGIFLPDSVSSVFFDGDFQVLELRSGASVRARQIFDASGHTGSLVRRDPTYPAFQTAFGVRAHAEHAPSSQETMGLMLWDNGLFHDSEEPTVPAFYYEMPISADETFLEYTVLAARPLVPVARIEQRVRRDLGSRMVEGAPFERCVIPMGHNVPDLDQPIVGFGGAASMVHPATGYMAARVLRTAPALAEAYEASRTARGTVRSAALWRVVWPEEQVRTHELYRFGLEALLTLDVPQTHEFFHTFFQLPVELWRPYQAGTATPRGVAAAMWEVFAKASGPLRRKLVAAGLGPNAPKLLRLLR